VDKNDQRFLLAFFGLMFLILVQIFIVKAAFQIAGRDPLVFSPEFAADFPLEDQRLIGAHYQHTALNNVLFANIFQAFVFIGFCVCLFVPGEEKK